MRHAMIMAGGSGTRLWPLSTADHPKQLVPLIRGRSLLQVAADRLEGLIEPERRLICTGERYRAAIRGAIPRFGDEQIIGEPEGRDTLGAVGLPAAIVAQQDPEAAIAVFTADHLIEPVDVFQQRVSVGFEIAERQPETLVTFGIEPTRPATGYGYVELGPALDGFEDAYRANAFKEKPDEESARRYLESGQYRWNSGMFVWRAATVLDCIRRYEPEVHEKLMRIAEAWGTERGREVLAEVYPTLKKISVDYAVMEPASRDERVSVATVSMPVKWLDVGGWPAYGQTLEADESGNQLAAGKALSVDSANTLIVSDDDDHLVATLGVRDLIIVRTGRATLVCHKDAAEQIKQLHQRVKETFGEGYV